VDACRKVIRNEHCLPKARAELERLWKQLVAQNIERKAAERDAVVGDDDNTAVLLMEADSLPSAVSGT
jgi:hypothetical protein